MSYPAGYHCAGGGYAGSMWAIGDVAMVGANVLGYVTYPQAFLAYGITTSTPASLARSRICRTPSRVLSAVRLAPGSIQSARCGGVRRAASAGEVPAERVTPTMAAPRAAPRRRTRCMRKTSKAEGRV